MTPDPIGLEGGINLFVYVQNNPAIDTDTSGLSKRKKECEKAAAKIRGILNHLPKHQVPGRTINPICAQLGRELGPFIKNGCLALPEYKDLGLEALDFIRYNCPRETEKLEECCKKLRVPIIVVIGGLIAIEIVELCLLPGLPPLVPVPL